jgi:hypothetical protein
MSDDHFSTFQIPPEDQQAFVSVSISYEEFKEGFFLFFLEQGKWATGGFCTSRSEMNLFWHHFQGLG